MIPQPDISIVQYLPNGRLFNLALRGAPWEMGAVEGLVHIIVDVFVDLLLGNAAAEVQALVL